MHSVPEYLNISSLIVKYIAAYKKWQCIVVRYRLLYIHDAVYQLLHDKYLKK